VGEKRDRDVEKVYSTSEFVAELRRLADALEAGERFEIQVASPPHQLRGGSANTLTFRFGGLKGCNGVWLA